MSDISEPALERALAKVKEICPEAAKVETMICDVSKEASVEAVVTTGPATSSHGRGTD